jgi:hypothetical protein
MHHEAGRSDHGDNNAPSGLILGETSGNSPGVAAGTSKAAASVDSTTTAGGKAAELVKNSEAANSPDDDETKPAAEEEACAKKSDRVERKRNREKQRRLDTNSQFTALAAIVREIETTDFADEAQFNSLYELAQQKEGGLADTDGNKRLKSDFPGESIQNSISAAGTYSASNRVELIARTTLMLSQFRAIRKKRNEELRDARSQNCEMRKEVEDLRRMVAHYKTMGLGQQKPQDKVRTYGVKDKTSCIILLLTVYFIAMLCILDYDDGANDGTPRCCQFCICWFSCGSSHAWWLFCSSMDAISSNGHAHAIQHNLPPTTSSRKYSFCTTPRKSKCSSNNSV